MPLSDVLKKYPQRKDYLIEILLDYQREKPTHHFEQSELKEIADYLDIPESRVCSVVSFYSFFSFEKRGKFIVQVCHDVPCHLSESFDVLATLKALLKVDMDETTEDGLFTLEHTSCLGHCDKAPAIRINEKIYGNLTENKLKAIIAEYRGEKDA